MRQFQFFGVISDVIRSGVQVKEFTQTLALLDPGASSEEDHADNDVVQGNARGAPFERVVKHLRQYRLHCDVKTQQRSIAIEEIRNNTNSLDVSRI